MLLLLWNHDGHPDRTKAWDVETNRFWLRNTGTQKIGGFEEATSGTELWAGDNQWNFNLYKVTSTSVSYWKWDSGSGPGVAKTFAQWQAFGFDLNGTRELI